LGSVQIALYILGAAFSDLPLLQAELIAREDQERFVVPSDPAPWKRAIPPYNIIKNDEFDIQKDMDEPPPDAAFGSSRKGKNKAKQAAVSPERTILRQCGGTGARVEALDGEYQAQKDKSQPVDYRHHGYRFSTKFWQRVLCVAVYVPPSRASVVRDTINIMGHIVISEQSRRYRREMLPSSAGALRFDLQAIMQRFAKPSVNTEPPEAVVGDSEAVRQWDFLDELVPKARPTIEVASAVETNSRQSKIAKHSRDMQKVVNAVQSSDSALADTGRLHRDVHAALKALMTVLESHAHDDFSDEEEDNDDDDDDGNDPVFTYKIFKAVKTPKRESQVASVTRYLSAQSPLLRCLAVALAPQRGDNAWLSLSRHSAAAMSRSRDVCGCNIELHPARALANMALSQTKNIFDGLDGQESDAMKDVSCGYADELPSSANDLRLCQSTELFPVKHDEEEPSAEDEDAVSSTGKDDASLDVETASPPDAAMTIAHKHGGADHNDDSKTDGTDHGDDSKPDRQQAAAQDLMPQPCTPDGTADMIDDGPLPALPSGLLPPPRELVVPPTTKFPSYEDPGWSAFGATAEDASIPELWNAIAASYVEKMTREAIEARWMSVMSLVEHGESDTTYTREIMDYCTHRARCANQTELPASQPALQMSTADVSQTSTSGGLQAGRARANRAVQRGDSTSPFIRVRG
jgi:hypothetical protein